MGNIKFVNKRNNLTGKWMAAVECSKKMVTSDHLTARMLYQHNIDRKKLCELTEWLRLEMMKELIEGNEIDLFGFVRLTPKFSLKKSFCGEKNDVDSALLELSEKDVKIGVRAHINQGFNHEFVKQKKRLKRRVAHN